MVCQSVLEFADHCHKQPVVFVHVWDRALSIVLCLMVEYSELCLVMSCGGAGSKGSEQLAGRMGQHLQQKSGKQLFELLVVLYFGI